MRIFTVHEKPSFTGLVLLKTFILHVEKEYHKLKIKRWQQRRTRLSYCKRSYMDRVICFSSGEGGYIGEGQYTNHRTRLKKTEPY